MKTCSLKMLAVGLVSTLSSILPLAAKQPPPFGDSITWSTGKESPTLEGMRGKSVLVLFFQSWCPICNEWSPGLFKQLGEAYGNDPKVVLIALKTDGGGLDEAFEYMKSRTDPDLWLVGVEENASYYRQATGDDKLYTYMWVKPDGSIGKMDGASFHDPKGGKKNFTLASDRAAKEYRNGSTPLMPIDPPLDEALKPAVEKAEIGLYLSALKEVGGLASDASLKDDVATFKGRIAERLESSVKRYQEAIEDEKNEDRYLAYLALKRIEEDFGASAPGQAAKKAVAVHASASWVSNEEEAAKDYQSIMRKAERADDERSRERIAKALKKLADEFPDTIYGRIAMASKG